MKSLGIFKALQEVDNGYNVYVTFIPLFEFLNLFKTKPWNPDDGISEKQEGRQRKTKLRRAKRIAKQMEYDKSSDRVVSFCAGIAASEINTNSLCFHRGKLLIYKILDLLDAGHRMRALKFILDNPMEYPLMYEHVMKTKTYICMEIYEK